MPTVTSPPISAMFSTRTMASLRLWLNRGVPVTVLIRRFRMRQRIRARADGSDDREDGENSLDHPSKLCRARPNGVRLALSTQGVSAGAGVRGQVEQPRSSARARNHWRGSCSRSFSVEAGGVSLRDGHVLMPEDPGKDVRWQTRALGPGFTRSHERNRASAAQDRSGEAFTVASVSARYSCGALSLNEW